MVVFYLEGGLETSQKEQKLGKSFYKTSFHLGMGPKKVQKQGRDESTQKDYHTSAVYFFKMYGSLLVSFHLCLVSILFSTPSLTEMKS